MHLHPFYPSNSSLKKEIKKVLENKIRRKQQLLKRLMVKRIKIVHYIFNYSHGVVRLVATAK
jgi:hypothetical protein